MNQSHLFTAPEPSTPPLRLRYRSVRTSWYGCGSDALRPYHCLTNSCVKNWIYQSPCRLVYIRHQPMWSSNWSRVESSGEVQTTFSCVLSLVMFLHRTFTFS